MTLVTNTVAHTLWLLCPAMKSSYMLIPGQGTAPWGQPAPLLPALTWEPAMQDMPMQTPGKPSKMALDLNGHDIAA